MLLLLLNDTLIRLLTMNHTVFIIVYPKVNAGSLVLTVAKEFF